MQISHGANHQQMKTVLDCCVAMIFSVLTNYIKVDYEEENPSDIECFLIILIFTLDENFV